MIPSLVLCCLLGQPTPVGEGVGEAVPAAPPGRLSAGSSGGPSDPDRLEAVARLVRQLGASQLRQREEAERRLLESGPGILPLLPSSGNLPAEIQGRLRRIVETLEKRASVQVTQGSRVTLEGRFTLDQALAALEDQTGNHARLAGGGGAGAPESGETTLQLALRDVPYWEAIDRLCDLAELDVAAVGGQRRVLTLVPRRPGIRPRHGAADYAGMFRFEATQVRAVRDLRNDAVRGLRVLVNIGWEPAHTPISLAQPLSRLSAVDDGGQAVAVDGVEGERSAAGSSDYASVDLELPLTLPGRQVQRLNRLRGELRATLPGRRERFEFTDLSRPDQLLRRAGTRVLLQQVRQNERLHEVRIRVLFDEAGNALESHRGWIYENPAYLVDDAGQRLEVSTTETTSQDPTSIGFAYLFALDKPLAQYRFVYETPTTIVRLTVPFELKDIPLP